MALANSIQKLTPTRTVTARIGTAATLLVLIAAAIACAAAPSTPPPAPPKPEPKITKELVAEQRNRPEVIYATKLVTPFSSMRYTLSHEGSPEAEALAEEVAATLDELRKIRLDPDAMTWDAMKAKTDAMVAKVAASKFASDPSIVKAMERYRQFIAEYEAAKGGTPQ